MRIPTAEESLQGWERARGSKVRILLFCLFGFVVGMGGYFISYLPTHWARVDVPLKTFDKWAALTLAAIYGGAVIFFLVSLFTNIWERICDYKIKKFRDRIANPK